jgi:hypothetical protein
VIKFARHNAVCVNRSGKFKCFVCSLDENDAWFDLAVYFIAVHLHNCCLLERSRKPDDFRSSQPVMSTLSLFSRASDAVMKSATRDVL